MPRFKRYLIVLLLLSVVPVGVILATSTPPPPQPTPTFVPTVTPLRPIPTSTVYFQPTQPPPSAEDLFLQIGETISGEIRLDGNLQRFVFTGRAGQLVNIRFAMEPAINVAFSLQDLSNFFVSPLASGVNQQTYILPYDGSFAIVVSTYDSPNRVYNYTLSVTEPEPQLIEFGQTVEGTMDGEQPVGAYVFDAEAGDLVSLLAIGQQIPPNLIIREVGSTTDLQYTGGSFISRDNFSFSSLIELPATSRYLVVVSLGVGSSEDYSLTLNSVTPQEISYGETITIEFDEESNAAYYNLEADPGDVIDIRVNSDGDVDTLLNLIQLERNIGLTGDDDSGTDLDPEINRFQIAERGTYTIIVTTYGLNTTGSAELTVEQNPNYILGSGPRTIDLTKRGNEVFSYEAEAGERLRLTVRVISGEMPDIRVTQPDEGLFFMDAFSLDEITIEIEAVVDDVLLVRLNRNSPISSQVEISLEPIDS